MIRSLTCWMIKSNALSWFQCYVIISVSHVKISVIKLLLSFPLSWQMSANFWLKTFCLDFKIWYLHAHDIVGGVLVISAGQILMVIIALISRIPRGSGWNLTETFVSNLKYWSFEVSQVKQWTWLLCSELERLWYYKSFGSQVWAALVLIACNLSVSVDDYWLQ